MSEKSAETAPDHADARLRGRTYAIPFEQVWNAALALAGGGLRGWRLLEHDDYEGVIRVAARPLVGSRIDDVVIRISLDQDAQTRVDMRSASSTAWFDLGANARRIAKFFRRLDERLAKERGRPVNSR